MIKFYKKILILLFLCILSTANIVQSQNLTTDFFNNDLNQKKIELEQKIKEKTAELEKINQELQNTQSNLESVQKEKNTLQNEIKKLNENLKQLELNIKSDERTIEKLELEIDSLNIDIQNINTSIGKKKNTIIKSIQELQKIDNKNILLILLDSNNLADSFLKIQSLSDLKRQLQEDIKKLDGLYKELNNKLDETISKKEDIEARKNNLVVRREIVKDQEQTKKVILSQTQNKESLYQKQLAELQRQQETLEEEIYKMEEELRKTFNVGVLPAKRSGVLEWPIRLKIYGGVGVISQKYGQTLYSNRLYRGKPHNGLDISAPIGTPVYAADKGVVMHVDNNDKNSWAKYQYGKYVLIKHSNGLATLYAHLSKWTVSKGQEVERGQLIGYSGNTGYSTGPHLHFGVYWASTIILKSILPAAGLVPVGVTINPEDYL